jgi:hypothetical protein
MKRTAMPSKMGVETDTMKELGSPGKSYVNWVCANSQAYISWRPRLFHGICFDSHLRNVRQMPKLSSKASIVGSGTGIPVTAQLLKLTIVKLTYFPSYTMSEPPSPFHADP